VFLRVLCGEGSFFLRSCFSPSGMARLPALFSTFNQESLMRSRRLGLILSLCLAVLLTCLAQGQRQRPSSSEAAPTPAAAPAAVAPATQAPGGDKLSDAAARPAPEAKEAPEEKPVVTHHEIHVGGKTLRYTATTGMMPIRDAAGKLEAHIFYMAYTLDNPGARRPLTFSFNGGPGSSSVWLHLGAIGPRRIKMQPEGFMPAPPYQVVDNEATWLDQTDLVFLDPVGTGYSRAVTPELGKKFWGVQGDIESVGEFIRLYLVRNERWNAPLFIVGESYGTFRAAGLAGYLIDRGVALNGVMLISTILNYGTHEFTRMNDLPYALILPSYTATAWYHKKLSPELQQQPVARVAADAGTFAESEYLSALAKGDRLSAQERQAVIQKMSGLTGLSPLYLDESNLRVSLQFFLKELGRSDKKTYGRLDSRFEGIDLSAATATPEYDPSMAAIIPPYTSAFNNYVRSELGYKSDLIYYILGGGIGPWDSGQQYRGGFQETAEALRTAFAKNPYMKLFVACGYYDMATPFFATQYTINHMGLPAEAHQRITMTNYEAGHMMYIHSDSLSRLRKDVGTFYENALR
jgi:carboxypeptidase C (cathepsin A)